MEIRSLFMFALILTAILITMILSRCSPESGKAVEPSKPKAAKKPAAKVEKPSSNKSAKTEISNTAMTLYFSDNQAQKLVPVTTAIAESQPNAQEIIRQLIAGTKDTNLHNTIPAGTKLLAVVVTNGTAEVDFSKEFVDNHSAGSATEIMTIYSVVNSLTELPSIKAVRFLVQGQQLETLNGHMDISNPISRRADLIQQ